MNPINKIYEAHAIVTQAKRTLNTIDKLKISLATRNRFSNELVSANEALELLRVRILSVIKETKGGAE